jgi:hypothetical protein
MFVIHGKNDELFDINHIKLVVEGSIKKGNKITFKILENRSHYEACNYVEALKEMALLLK